MKNFKVLIILFLLSSCATSPKKEYQWYTPEGALATPEQVADLKAGCNYDEKMEEISSQIRIGISVARYDSPYGRKGSEKYSRKAAQLMQELNICLRKGGYYTKEKAQP